MKKQKKMRETKHAVSERICNYINENNLKNKIKINDGERNAEIRMYDKKEYSPLTFGYIEKCLNKIIHDEEQVNYVIDFLKENREITSSHDIRKVHTN
jgi:alpha-acetolactate decarboxylase